VTSDPAPTPRLTLGRTRRLTHNREYQAVYAGRMKKPGRFLMLWAVPGENPSWRLGLSVSSRVGGATIRVRCKRLIREAFRHLQHEFPTLDDRGFDAVVGVRTAEGITLEAVKQELASLATQTRDEWAKRRRRAAKSDGGSA
jgi:ribonuclease P protein component